MNKIYNLLVLILLDLSMSSIAKAQPPEDHNYQLIAEAAVELIKEDLFAQFAFPGEAKIEAPSFEFTKFKLSKDVLVVQFTNPVDSIFSDATLNSFISKQVKDENGLIIDNSIEVIIAGGCQVKLAVKNNLVTDQIKSIKCTNIRLMADEPQDDLDPITYSVSISR